MLSEIRIDWIYDATPSVVNAIHEYFINNPQKFTAKQRVVEKTLYSLWASHPDTSEADMAYCRVLDMTGILQYEHILDMNYEVKYNRLQKRA